MDSWVLLYLWLTYVGALLVFGGIGWSIFRKRQAFYQMYAQSTQPQVCIKISKHLEANQETYAGTP